MSRDNAYLLDILDSARTALDYIKDKSWEDFSGDPILRDAIVRRLEIIGEASGRVSAETQREHPQLPWQAMKGPRNRVVHEYDSIDLEVIWDIVEQDLPLLVSELEKIVSPEENN